MTAIDEFLLQPSIYSTHGNNTLLELLEDHWIKDVELGKGTFYLISGFGNYNGGVRFYDHFKEHVKRGGKVKSLFGGSTSQHLTSMQLAEALLHTGATVDLLNRKHLMHAKCYGYKYGDKQSLIVTSGNFTGPGMSQNIEVAVSLSNDSVVNLGFDWDDFFKACIDSSESIYSPTLPHDNAIDWTLLYNEVRGKTATISKGEDITMLVLLGHADTARINANPGERSGLGSQYFWLSKDAFNFFPALTIPNSRGTKPTYSTKVEMNFTDLNIKEDVKVTFEAGNNLDFRLGTGPLRYSHTASEFDIAAITRRKNASYDMKIIHKSDPAYADLSKYLTNFIGHAGKKYGYLDNSIYDNLTSSR